jgi:hypothetical protein
MAITHIVATTETIYWVLDNGGKLHVGQTDPGQTTSTSNPVYQSTDKADILTRLSGVRHRMPVNTDDDDRDGFVYRDGEVSYRTRA